MSKSIRRVAEAAARAGLEIEIRRMGESTRTAAEAARQCGCSVEQIVKSLIFAGEDSGRLYLFLVSGSRQLDLEKAASVAGEKLVRADPRKVREETGFAIGGVSPLGHDETVRRYADRTLLGFPIVWAAAGAHDAVFAAEPRALINAAKAEVADIVT
ncbi:YbaK/EbsC family protein [Chelativorans intermedius]|uniref:YbaK/EbsC family protein n=1 Tax=Chelativorans intermedius TaxID=515947 RepID=A0ABV6D730_9HYPH|nr:YbaK/EbsC family protein [Chelativorans intermedius]MCT8999523.1 YbaK/EbsC family protein [Chelativorans intermedius]